MFNYIILYLCIVLIISFVNGCSDSILSKDCGNNNNPVLGGVDFVQYFTTFKLSNGSYDETRTGIQGLSAYSYDYNGYNFHFLSDYNLNLFKSSPNVYLPQWGAYCAWGIAAEFAPTWQWDVDCLGPTGNWSSWTIFNEKLYFFKDNTPKSQFMVNPAYYVQQGDDRWFSWFSNTSYNYNTNCYK
mmetsp:Transcript_16696/g.15058  ORF Transcript_16696/g.15058 Transcript_16696/m.15058 type:complete len:185 (+) Transcript_16696:35-589(+)